MMAPESLLKVPVESLKGIGRGRAKFLAKLGIFVIEDLLFHFPLRYEDRTKVIPLGELPFYREGSFWGKVIEVTEIRPKPKLTILRVFIKDDTGSAIAVWFNQPYLKTAFKRGASLFVTGRVERSFQGNIIKVGDYEVLESGEIPRDYYKIIPVYPTTAGLSKKVLQKIIQDAVAEYAVMVRDVLPGVIQEHYNIMKTGRALKQIHGPDSLEQAERARKTLAYEELLLWQLKLQGEKFRKTEKEGFAHKMTGPLSRAFVNQLPYKLTGSQEIVLKEIYADMENKKPMARLLQGDVGSGKTVVAILSLLKAIDNNSQGVFMVPTEILAEQHYLGLKNQLEKLKINAALLIGGLSKKEKDKIKTDLLSGNSKLVIGTHALLEDEIKFKRLGLVVVDEQHRFGVAQRGRLLENNIVQPDLLIMTATPIPRTLALAYYGDLDFSIIDEMPPGRLPVETKYWPESKRTEVYNFIKKQLNEGRQGYIVCPLVEDSEKIAGEAAIKLFEELNSGSFKEYRLGLIYGGLPSSEKESIMGDFRMGRLDLLVATTVIEVGVDVPNASIILINDCQRFGLAQLHQLRGRVGRGEIKSYCFLMGSLRSKETQARVKSMLRYRDGYSLAEEDLKIRGPGDFFGVRQHGMPEFKVARLLTDQKLLQLAQRDASLIYKNKNSPENAKLISRAEKKYAEFLP